MPARSTRHSRSASPEPQLRGPLDVGPHDRRILSKLLKLSPQQVADFRGAIAEGSERWSLDYVKDSGERILIPVNPVPVLPTRRQLTYLKRVVAVLNGVVARVGEARLKDPVLQAMLELSDAELRWLAFASKAPGHPARRVFHRWDAAIELANDIGAGHTKFFEVNSVDVGGVHYAAATRAVLLEALQSVGVKGLSLSSATAGRDPRAVLLADLREHARDIGRELRFVAIAENQEFDAGVTEAPSLARYFREHGVAAECVDPRNFELSRRKVVTYQGRAVDVIYRNIELRDVVDLEDEGHDLAAFRAAAQQGLFFSSPHGELDHKSLWEVLGAPDHWPSLSAAERRAVARHIPWTRLVAERNTQGPSGNMIDLPEYVRRYRNRLVLKPNRSCGGQGVTIGSVTSRADWERTLDEALAAPCSWVVQEVIAIPRRRSVALGEDGSFVSEKVFGVYGLFASSAGLAILGRASRNPVVNVMQGGGMLAVLGLDER
ncbi:MAG: hypothetical protein IPK07_11505 [Deltaproteobacteria bacterium]|nr:hypothetical protein [Deltaproteobacteria bacterium]